MYTCLVFGSHNKLTVQTTQQRRMEKETALQAISSEGDQAQPNWGKWVLDWTGAEKGGGGMGGGGAQERCILHSPAA